MKRILVVNVNWLGDAVFSAPVFRALKDAFPQAHVAVLGVARIRDVMERVPEIDEIIVFDDKKDLRSPWGVFRLVQRLRAGRFDAAFFLKASGSRTFLAFCAGIPVRVGYAKQGREGLLTFPLMPLDEPIHRSDVYLGVLEGYGIPVKERRCVLVPKAEDIAAFQEAMRDRSVAPGEPYIVFHCGGNWALKRWPPEFFAELAGLVCARLGVRVILSGSEADVPLCASIARASQHERVSVLAGRLGIGGSMALFAGSALMVSSDSGPLHLAASVGARVLGLYGPTRPRVTGPRGPGQADVLFRDIGCNKAPCYYLECPRNDCLRALTVDHVYKTIAGLLSSQ